MQILCNVCSLNAIWCQIFESLLPATILSGFIRYRLHVSYPVPVICWFTFCMSSVPRVDQLSSANFPHTPSLLPPPSSFFHYIIQLLMVIFLLLSSARQILSAVSTTSPQQWFLAAILLGCNVQYAWLATNTMYAKWALIHLYVGEGMEEGEFSDRLWGSWSRRHGCKRWRGRILKVVSCEMAMMVVYLGKYSCCVSCTAKMVSFFEVMINR